MKYFFLLFTLIFSFNVFGQSKILWNPGFELSFSDFQSPQSVIDPNLRSYAIQSGIMLELGYQMTGYEMMFTKNFNSKIKATFNPKTAAIIAISSQMANDMVYYAIVEFDLAELYARKLRRELFINKKSFSDFSIFEMFYNKNYERMSIEATTLLNESNIGRNKDLLNAKHLEILNEIEQLSDFCYDCKPVKKKKKKQKKNL